jgi:hypothetical protein
MTIGWDSTDTDERGLVYSAGPLEGKHFRELVQPGSSLQILGWYDYMIKLPANQRTYIVAENGDQGDVAGGKLITATDSEGVALDFATSSTFELDSSAKQLNEFYLKICTKYDDCEDKDGTSDDGWAWMLNDYYRKAQESALQQVTQQYTVDELMKNDRTEFQQEVAESTEEKLQQNMGGEYFTNITFQIQRPIPPNAVQERYNAAKAAELQTQVKAEEVKQAEQQANAAEELAQTLNENPNYLGFRWVEVYEDCVDKPNCQLPILMPEGGGVNVNVQP